MEIHDSSVVEVKFIFQGYLAEYVESADLMQWVPKQLTEAIKIIYKNHPALEEPIKTGAYIILLNKLSLMGQDLSQVYLADNDELIFVPFVAGG